MKKTVLVVAAHPDDEILGCGATMAKHTKQGDRVHVLILAEGLTSRSNTRNRGAYLSELSDLSKSAEKANKIIGARTLRLHDFPDNRMDGVELLDVVKVIEAAISDLQPDMIYTHYLSDVNVDHQAAHEAVITACRPQPAHCVESLLFFEVPSSTEWQVGPKPAFQPNWFNDVSSTIRTKLKALNAYKSEMRSWPHTRSLKAIEHLARWRGATVGVDAAEAFVLGRQINKKK